MNHIDDIIKSFSLVPHPEGGYYRETYRSVSDVKTVENEFDGVRSASTAIYYLLTAGTYSAFHRIKSDEVWHFYCGGPLRIVEIDPESKEITETILGSNTKNQEVFQHVVPAKRWFGAQPMPETDFSLVGCTVAPGFDFRDFELADAATFLDLFPKATDWGHLLPQKA